MEWQPIETAPKDGTEFQAWLILENDKLHGFWEPRCKYNEDGILGIWGRIDYDEEDWDYTYFQLVPTHWMPLPEPPKVA